MSINDPELGSKRASRPQADRERLAGHDANFPLKRHQSQIPFFEQARSHGFLAEAGSDFLPRHLAIPSQSKARHAH